MKFIIVRHGEAEYSANDDTRKLTDTGKREADSVGRFLDRVGINPQFIIHSRKKRSYETAVRVSEILNARESLHLEENAGPGGNINDILGIIDNTSDCAVLVSHIPLVYTLSSHLLFYGNPGNILNFSTGTVLLLSRDSELGTVNMKQRWNLCAFLKPLEFGF